MSAKTATVLLVASVAAAAFVLYRLFNLCTYYFWLANQRIEGRENYERMLYFSLAGFVLILVLECVVFWKLIKKANQSEES
jgi:hypothetical protein